MPSASVHLYSFANPPHQEPELYFPERHLRELLIYGSLTCPYKRTLFDSINGEVGRWTLHYDEDATDINIYEPVMPQLTEKLPGMRMRYEDHATGNTWVWVLTDIVLHRDNDNDLRYAVWPD